MDVSNFGARVRLSALASVEALAEKIGMHLQPRCCRAHSRAGQGVIPHIPAARELPYRAHMRVVSQRVVLGEERRIFFASGGQNDLVRGIGRRDLRQNRRAVGNGR